LKARSSGGTSIGYPVIAQNNRGRCQNRLSLLSSELIECLSNFVVRIWCARAALVPAAASPLRGRGCSASCPELSAP
jgi:hypothetical protein